MAKTKIQSVIGHTEQEKNYVDPGDKIISPLKI
jgi:hypothetical protein